MHGINVILDIDQEYLMIVDLDFDKKIARKQIIKDKDDLFEFVLKRGLVKKTEEGYVFVGKLKDLTLANEAGKKL
jgi:hypothetical protein